MIRWALLLRRACSCPPRLVSVGAHDLQTLYRAVLALQRTTCARHDPKVPASRLDWIFRHEHPEEQEIRLEKRRDLWDWVPED